MSFEKKAKCADGACTAYAECKIVTSKDGKEFRACYVCENLVYPPKQDRCANKACDSWAAAASTAFTDGKGTERRKCGKCNNLVFADLPKTAGFKRPASVVAATESETTTHIQINNLNSRLGALEQSVAQILASMSHAT